jgi:hypothetical protein
MENRMTEAKKPEATEVKVKKYKLTVSPGGEGQDNDDVFLAVNTKPVLIQRGKEVIVEECYIEALKNSVIETTERNEKGEMVPIRIPRFNFSFEPA